MIHVSCTRAEVGRRAVVTTTSPPPEVTAVTPQACPRANPPTRGGLPSRPSPPHVTAAPCHRRDGSDAARQPCATPGTAAHDGGERRRARFFFRCFFLSEQ
jgi:hypothetical protein